MKRIILQRNCLLCGAKTIEPDDICCSCKEQAYVISGAVCSKCGIPLVSEDEICLRCRETSYHFEKNISLFEYCGSARDIFYQYKFAGNKIVSLWYASLLDCVIFRDFPDHFVVPSPGSYMKKVRKGWDQVELICHHLKKRHGLPVVKALRKKDGGDQKKLDLQGRRDNLTNRISVTKKIEGFVGRDVLLIDDIFTTGATADQCSKVLLGKGVKSVTSLTIAID